MMLLTEETQHKKNTSFLLLHARWTTVTSGLAPCLVCRATHWHPERHISLQLKETELKPRVQPSESSWVLVPSGRSRTSRVDPQLQAQWADVRPPPWPLTCSGQHRSVGKWRPWQSEEDESEEAAQAGGRPSILFGQRLPRPRTDRLTAATSGCLSQHHSLYFLCRPSAPTITHSSLA